MKKLIEKFCRWFLTDTLQKLEKDCQEAQDSIVRVQNTLGAIVAHTEDRVKRLEAAIVNSEEKLQKLFYNEEKNLLELLSTGVIDPKEHYYSQQLLKRIEKEIDVIQAEKTNGTIGISQNQA